MRVCDARELTAAELLKGSQSLHVETSDSKPAGRTTAGRWNFHQLS